MRKAGSLVLATVLVASGSTFVTTIAPELMHLHVQSAGLSAYSLFGPTTTPEGFGKSGSLTIVQGTPLVVGGSGSGGAVDAAVSGAQLNGTQSPGSATSDLSLFPGSGITAPVNDSHADPSLSPGRTPAEPVIVDSQDSQIGTSIPAVSFGATDGLPVLLSRGLSYTVTLPVVRADPDLNVTASLLARGLTLDPSCTNYPLLAAQVVQLTCTVTVNANAVSAWLRGAANGVGSKIIRHSIDTTTRATALATITSSPTTLEYGVAGSATISLSAPGYTPTGSAALFVDGQRLTAASLVGGQATFVLPSTLGLGTHTLDATYSGDSWLAGVSAQQRSITVVKATPQLTMANLMSPAGPIVSVGVSTLGTASVSGTITITERGVTIGSGTVIDGSAQVTLPSTLTPGTHTFTVAYSGTSVVASGVGTLVESLL